MTVAKQLSVAKRYFSLRSSLSGAWGNAPRSFFPLPLDSPLFFEKDIDFEGQEWYNRKQKCPIRRQQKSRKVTKNTMKKIDQSIRTLFIFALVWSILMVVGVPLIIFGASKPDWLPIPTFFFILGIIFSGGGFYGVPLLWVAYGNKRDLRGYVYAVEVLELRDVKGLASHLRRPEEEVRVKLDICLTKGYLPTLIRDGDRLVEPTPRKKPEEAIHDVVCPCCNAHFTYRGDRGVCPYCGVAYQPKSGN